MNLIHFFLVLLILFSLSAENVFGGQVERYRPKYRHYAALQLREECSIRQAVLSRVKRERVEKKTVLGEIQATLRERRTALEQCAALNGIKNWDSEDEDLFIAQACQEQYDLWLTPGYHIEIVEREVHELERTFEKLNNYVFAYCK